MMDERYMHRAMELARQAADEGEVPVGAVIVYDGQIVGEGRNRREALQNALCHAEIEAIDAACKYIGSWRLCDCDLYVTLEPCPMCAGAIINSRIRTVYFGASDPKGGAVGSLINLFELPEIFRVQSKGGICGEECSALLSEFFASLRRARQQKQLGENL